MKLKRVFKIIVLSLICFGYLLNANATNKTEDKMTQLIKQEIQDKSVFWNKLQTCSVYSTNYQGIEYKILGKEKNSCHVKMGSLDCKFTGTSAQKYATINLNYGKRILSDIKRTNGFSVSTNDPEAKSLNVLNSEYCRIEF